MNTVFAALLLSLSLIANPVDICPLEQKDVHREWIVLPAGMVVVEKEGLWVLYSAKLILCSAWFLDYRLDVVFIDGSEGFPACYLIDPQPIGYYEEDPSKTFEQKMTPLTERTWHEETRKEKK